MGASMLLETSTRDTILNRGGAEWARRSLRAIGRSAMRKRRLLHTDRQILEWGGGEDTGIQPVSRVSSGLMKELERKVGVPSPVLDSCSRLKAGGSTLDGWFFLHIPGF